MIGYLHGRVEKGCVVAGGVGYIVDTPAVLEDGETVELTCVPVWTDGALKIYGFRAEQDKTVFEILIKAPGVGPAIAMGAIAVLGSGGVLTALKNKDVDALARIPRLGKKRAEKLLLDVKLPEIEIYEDTPGTGELQSVLEDLGYSKTDARAAAKDAVAKTDGLEKQLAEALSILREKGV